MARPIPYNRDLSKFHEEEIKPAEHKSYIDLTIDSIRNKSTKNLVFGTITGWLAGFTVVKIGKVAAFGLGGGVLILHFASEGGYINVNWDKVKDAAAQCQSWMDQTFQFVKNNSCYSVGFVGGFFFGIGCT